MTKKRTLLKTFQPISYRLAHRGDVAMLTIAGKKAGPPSKRITLHQKGLRIQTAKMWRTEKGQEVELPVKRINPHDGFEEVRLHSEQILYHGNYKIYLEYHLPADKLERLKSGSLDRTIAPIIDEPDAIHEITQA